MVKGKRKNEVKVYRPKWYVRTLWILIGIGVVLAHFPLIQSDTYGSDTIPTFFLFIGLIFIIFDAFLLWWISIFITSTQLVVYEEGLELQRGESRHFSTWGNMSHLGRGDFQRNHIYGIHLHSKVQPKVNSFIDKLYFGKAKRFIEISPYVYVPTRSTTYWATVDLEKFAKTEFGQDLMHYAPHLFEKEKA